MKAKVAPIRPVNREALMSQIIKATFPGFEWDDSAERTAERFIAYLDEYVSAAVYAPPFDMTVFRPDPPINQAIMSGPINFSSICKHHLLPYLGKAWVGYLPNRLIIGASKMPRIVKWVATKPSTQEELCAEVATILKSRLEAQGVAVVMIATHTCMSCRGVREEDALLRNSEMRGSYLSNAAARAEFLALCGFGGFSG